MNRGELETVLGWGEAEGWNPGLDDAAQFHAADPEGFLVALHEGRPAASLAVDRDATGLDRPRFVAARARPGPDRRVRVHSEGGLGVLPAASRAGSWGRKLGRLLARGPEVAADLLADLAADAPAEPIMLDVPEPNVAGPALAHRAGRSPVFETARMWTGPAPAANTARIFGVATLEFR